MKPKSIFKSRTALLALITAAAGSLAFVSPDAEAVITRAAPGILVALGILNLALRRVTKDRVALFPDSAK